MRLGETVHHIRSKGVYLNGEDAAERRAWLDEMGFVWDDLERRWEEAKSLLFGGMMTSSLTNLAAQNRMTKDITGELDDFNIFISRLAHFVDFTS